MLFNEHTTVMGWCSLQFTEVEYERLVAPGGTAIWKRSRDKYGKQEWQREKSRFTEHGYLCEEVDTWLRTHVGWSTFEYWEVDRPFYVDSADGLPDLNVNWVEVFREIPHDRRNWRWMGKRGELMFRTPAYASAFKLAWG